MVKADNCAEIAVPVSNIVTIKSKRWILIKVINIDMEIQIHVESKHWKNK